MFSKKITRLKMFFHQPCDILIQQSYLTMYVLMIGAPDVV